ncbi:MAG: efflux RND transporter periplasmic adaptor subunit [Bdellovibrionales bacterium]
MSCTKKIDSTVKTGKVEKTDVIQRTTLNGSLRGNRQSQIQPGYSGYVGKVFVKVGEDVKAGQALVSITQTINQNLNEVFPIRAPFAGKVTQILKQEGEYISTSSSNNALLVLDDLTSMWIDANIPEVDIAKVSLGLEAQIRANALPGRTYKGAVQTLSLSSKAATDRWDRGRVEFPAEIRVLDPDQDLKPGMTVVVDVISAKVEGVLAVRHEFVHRERGDVFLIDKNDRRYPVELGLSNEDMVEIRSGVSEGFEVKMKDFTKL